MSEIYGTRRHIAIVDDDKVNLELAENALGDYYKITKLISGQQLLKFLTRVKPDMILLDVQMTDMNGYEVMQIISQNPEYKKIPVIFLTGQDTVFSEREGFRLGAKDFIKKPFDNEIMLARIRSQMELHIYQTDLEEIVKEKTEHISILQHVITISWAEMVESRDGTTGSHIRNTTAYFEILIRALHENEKYKYEFGSENLNDLLRASALHDIGKISISDTVLKKPGPLNKEEFEQMKQHSRKGADLIDKIVAKTHNDAFLNCARDMALYHHERWDGSGYPCGISGTDIPFYVRALSIVDVYDALTSLRPYKEAFSHDDAMLILKSENKCFFDPGIFEVFMENEQLIKEMPKDIYDLV
ncbi:MAG: response regulator [Oscillospiraceae bacterium]